MRKKISLALVGALLVTTLAGCGGSTSTTTTTTDSSSSTATTDSQASADSSTTSANVELTLIVASNQTSLDNPYSYGLDAFKEKLEEVSGGRATATVHKGTLGEDESTLVEKLTMGGADMIVCSPALMTGAGVKELDMFSCEYLFDSFDHWEACMDGEFGDAMKDIVLEKSGNQFKIMGYWSSSVRDVYAKKAVTSPDDLKGLTIRTQSAQVQQDFWKACGAIPTNVAWGELYQALQQGVCDGAENDYTNLMQKEHHKTDNGKYISETHHDFTTRLWIMTGAKYDSLTDEQKEWVQAASDAATEKEREVTFEMFETSKQKCIEDGAIITEHDDIDIDAFKALAIPIQDAFAEEYGMTEQLQMIRDAAQ
jgi:TRAP-type C4-dicarboxylate transport system substrate-binding protein